MKIDIRNDSVVYITLNPNTKQEKTVYIDDSTNELFIDAWKDKHKHIKPLMQQYKIKKRK